MPRSWPLPRSPFRTFAVAKGSLSMPEASSCCSVCSVVPWFTSPSETLIFIEPEVCFVLALPVAVAAALDRERPEPSVSELSGSP